MGLKLNIQKTKIMASGPITSWEIDGERVDTVSDFSFLGSKITAPGIINAYQDEFFSFDPKATPESKLEVKYMSDANHIWRYGYPDEETIAKHDKIQILTHPFAWTKMGYDNLTNYKTLVNVPLQGR